MAGSKFKKRDLNRFRKVYPIFKEKAVESFVGDKPLTLEVGKVTFTNTNTETHTFSQIFDSVPTITAIAVDSLSNNQANVNISVTSITTTNVTFKSSHNFSGTVQFHAILVGR